jgi:hypothetical protein
VNYAQKDLKAARKDFERVLEIDPGWEDVVAGYLEEADMDVSPDHARPEKFDDDPPPSAGKATP